MRGLSLLILAPLFLCTGCHVVEKAKQCERLSLALKHIAPRLLKDPIKSNPSPDLLKEKAAIYAELSVMIIDLHLTDKGLKPEALALANLVKALEGHLLAAAGAVELARGKERKLTTLPSGIPAERASSLVQNRQFLAAKSSIENASKSISLTLKHLELRCR